MVLVCGCGTVSDTRQPGQGGSPASTMTKDGVYEAGRDILPGVYTSKSLDCGGVVATSAAYDPADRDTDMNAFLRSAVRVGDHLRIVVNDGEFLTSSQCERWELQRTGSDLPDPGTHAGACEILDGKDRLISQVEAQLLATGGAQDRARTTDLQDKLGAVVDSHTGRLWEPTSRLVDLLDQSSLSAKGIDQAGNAIDDIRTRCASRKAP